MLTEALEARLVSDSQATAEQTVALAMQHAQTESGPAVAIIAEEHLPEASAALVQHRQAAQASHRGILLITLGPSDRATAKVDTQGFDLVVEPGWVHQVYAGVGSLLSPSVQSGRSTLLRLTGSLADRWLTLPVHGDGRSEAARLGEVGLAAWARAQGWNRVVASPVRDERSPMGLLSLGEASGALWRVLQRLGMNGRVAVGMIQAMQPLQVDLIRGLAERLQTMVVVGGDAAMFDRVRLAALETEAAARCNVVRGSVGLDGSPINLPGLKSHPAMAGDVYQERWEQVIDPPDAQTQPPRRQASVRQPVLPHGSLWRDVLSAASDVQKRFADGPYMLQTHRRDETAMDFYADLPQRSIMNTPPFESLKIQPWSSLGWMHPDERRPVVMLLDEATARRRLVTELDAGDWEASSLVMLVERDTGSTRRWPVGRRSKGMRLRDWRRLAQRMVDAKAGLTSEVNRMDVQDRARLVRLLERSAATAGVHVVLLEKAQRQAAMRDEQSEPTQEPWRWQVAERVCEHCLECTTRTGDPTLDLVRTPEGLKVQTVGSPRSQDGVFQRLDACPAFEQVRINGRLPAPGSRRESAVGRWLDALTSQLADPARPVHADAPLWRGHVAMVSGRGDDRLLQMLAQAGLRMGYHVSLRASRFTESQAARGSTAGSIMFRRMSQDDAPMPSRDFRRDLTGSRIPGTLRASTGSPSNAKVALATQLAPPQAIVDPTIDRAAAQVVIATDLNEASLATSGRGLIEGGFSAEQTWVISDRTLLPHWSQMLGRRAWSVEAAVKEVSSQVEQERLLMFDATDLAGRYLGDRGLATVVLFGAMLQRGLVPVSLACAKQGVEAVWQDRAIAAARAFTLGRAWATGSLYMRRRRVSSYWVGDGSGQSLTRHVRRRSVWLRLVCGRHGQAYSKAYQQQAETLRQRMQQPAVPEAVLSTALRRLADCVRWGGPAYGEQYVAALLSVYENDDPRFDMALTQAAAVNLARVMLIKDEVYVAQLLTDPAKRKRDDRRWRIDRGRGEWLTYHRLTRPEFSLFGRRYVFEWRAPRWQLRVLSKMRWMRRVLPWWHYREVSYRQWYLSQLAEIAFEDEATYRRWVTVLSLPSVTTGFRDALWRKISWSRRQAEHWLSQDIEQFKEPSWVGQVQPFVPLHDATEAKV